MKINLIDSIGLYSIDKKKIKETHSNRTDFASLLEEISRPSSSRASEALDEVQSSTSLEVSNLAEETLSSLEKVLEDPSSEEIAQDLEEKGKNLWEKASSMSGSACKLLEELALLATVEAQKVKKGFYS